LAQEPPFSAALELARHSRYFHLMGKFLDSFRTRLGLGRTLSDYEQRIVSNVAEHGWFCVAVGAGEDTPEFAYSVGFWETLKVPEFIIFGQPAKLTHSMLWSVFRQIRKGVATPGDGVRWSDLMEGFDCISRPVHESQMIREHFNSALWYRRHRTGDDSDLRAMQLFWPGAVGGLFPWQEGCDAFVRESQPALYLPLATGNA
jgi:hypothetical protein